MGDREDWVTLFLYNKNITHVSFHWPSGQLDHTNGQWGGEWRHSEAAERDEDGRYLGITNLYKNKQFSYVILQCSLNTTNYPIFYMQDFR